MAHIPDQMDPKDLLRILWRFKISFETSFKFDCDFYDDKTCSELKDVLTGFFRKKFESSLVIHFNAESFTLIDFRAECWRHPLLSTDVEVAVKGDIPDGYGYVDSVSRDRPFYAFYLLLLDHSANKFGYRPELAEIGQQLYSYFLENPECLLSDHINFKRLTFVLENNFFCSHLELPCFYTFLSKLPIDRFVELSISSESSQFLRDTLLDIVYYLNFRRSHIESVVFKNSLEDCIKNLSSHKQPNKDLVRPILTFFQFLMLLIDEFYCDKPVPLFKLQYILCIIQSNFKCTRFDEFKTFMVSLNDFTEIDSSFNQRLFVERMNELLFKLESLLSTKRSSKKQDINQIKNMIAEFLFRRLASYDVSIYSFNSKQDGCTIRTLLSYSCFVNNAIRIDLEKYPKASKICLSNIFFDFHTKALDLISLSHALFPSSVDMSVLTNRSLLVDFIKSCSDFMPNRIKVPLTLQKKDYFYLLVFYNNLLQEIGSSLSEVSLVLGIEFRYNLFFRELLIMDACFSDIDKCLRYISLLNTTSMDLLDSSKLEHDLLLNLETTIKQNVWNEVVQHCDVFSYLIMLIEAPLCVSVVKSLFDLTEVANDVGVVETDVVHFFRKQESFPISKGQIEELISILTNLFRWMSLIFLNI